jgi:hypothetical protein
MLRILVAMTLQSSVRVDTKSGGFSACFVQSCVEDVSPESAPPDSGVSSLEVDDLATSRSSGGAGKAAASSVVSSVSAVTVSVEDVAELCGSCTVEGVDVASWTWSGKRAPGLGSTDLAVK